MEDNHKLALIVAYYLSRYDKIALRELGYQSFKNAYEVIGSTLSVKPNTIKNMRDEFDPLHNNRRKGWHQRELRPSRMAVVEQCDNLSEQALREFVLDILNNRPTDHGSGEIGSYLKFFDAADQSEDESGDTTGSLRGITGILAEEIFMEKFRRGEMIFKNVELIDRRYHSVGYDFETPTEPSNMFEVKGLAGAKGAITFTDKEWDMARRYGERYILVIVSNIQSQPLISLIRDPYQKFTAHKSLGQQIVVRWTVNWTTPPQQDGKEA